MIVMNRRISRFAKLISHLAKMCLESFPRAIDLPEVAYGITTIIWPTGHFESA